ncbi:protein farnesyltransferase [Malassezia caprae]|uniref:Protein farnesyltransferase subunit beta n=1 Tax=Malassezia caprae TaxID=1381934 RepID=A0AAF0E5F0_9BASI|nr:protein farnesyltransferase [Malassezia caprae]
MARTRAMRPTPDDLFPTATSMEQACTESSIAALLAESSTAELRRDEHVAYLRRLLAPLPAPYVTFESNRAWLIYWVAHALDLLDAPLTGSLQARAISTLLHFQAPDGGFGGGPGQLGHLMSTYAAVCALAIVGGPGPAPSAADVAAGHSVDRGCGGWDAIDRRAIYAWMLRLKQPDGSFLVHEQGEIDVRATYCVVVVATLLGLATDELLEGAASFVASCQTYEGGFAALSTPSYRFDGHGVRPAGPVALQAPQGEAHGGYAYCALASYVHLAQVGVPGVPPVHVPRLVRWATSLQGAPIEGGGFRGRTNKLVDGCYGWFCGGGLHTLLEELATTSTERAATPRSADSWETLPEPRELLDREALATYVLAVAQAPRGGLRDKPDKRPDAYHTCYNLSGLSLCEHRVRVSDEALAAAAAAYEALVPPDRRTARAQACFAHTLAWSAPARSARVAATHPVLNVRLSRVAPVLTHMYAHSV